MTSTGKFIVGIEFAQNPFGKLKQPLKEALYNYYEFPNNDNWNDIYGMVIATGRVATVWQAVLAIDPTFPRSIPADAWETEDAARWSRIPTRDEFVKALNYVTKIQIDKSLLN
jgi:hypothetical protein